MIQHLLGLGMAVAIYLLLLRRGVPRWLAALATAPVLLDAYQLQIEQNVMPDVMFEALIMAGVVVQSERDARQHARLGRRQREHGQSARREGLSLSVRFWRNAGHTDRSVKQQTLPEALEYTWRGYPIADATNGARGGAADPSK